jgi:putative endonuclease
MACIKYNAGRWGTYYIMKRSGENKPAGAVKRASAARQGLGRAGESLAAEALRRRGDRVLEQNFRCVYGEIDLIAEDERDLIFVEVKTRRGCAYGLPEEAVTPRKQRKLVQVASHYLRLHACEGRSWRIDVVAVQLSTGGKPEEIRIYRYAVPG